MTDLQHKQINLALAYQEATNNKLKSQYLGELVETVKKFIYQAIYMRLGSFMYKNDNGAEAFHYCVARVGRAAAEFDPDRGCGFLSYLVWHIRAGIDEYISTSGIVAPHFETTPDVDDTEAVFNEKGFLVTKKNTVRCYPRSESLNTCYDDSSREKVALLPAKNGDEFNLWWHNIKDLIVTMYEKKQLTEREYASLDCYIYASETGITINEAYELSGFNVHSLREIKRTALKKVKKVLKHDEMMIKKGVV